MLVPPISRMGGKSKLRKTIIEMIPEHICYVEPFFGAGWVYFGKEPSQVEVINDIDRELVNLFRTIKYHEPELERLMKYEISSRDIFENYKSTPIDSLTEPYRAIRFLYLISQSFASKGNNYGYGTTKTPSSKIFTPEVLVDIRDRLQNTYVENLDFIKIIEKYDREHTFFFCDPPYLETGGYGVKFDEHDHIKLKDYLTNIKGKFLLTINDHNKIRKLYSNFNIKEVNVNYSISRSAEARKSYKELIITNYNY